MEEVELQDIKKPEDNIIDEGSNIEINSNSNNTNNNDKITTTNNNDENKSILNLIKEYFIDYFKKWKGYEKAPKRADFEEIGWSWLSSFIGILVLALLHYRVAIDKDMLMLIGSFGASAVLVFGAPKGPLSQPRNLVGGHIVSSIVGVTLRLALVYTNANIEVACALSVSLAIVVMHLTTTLHPPGGATSLIAIISSEQRWRGYYYCLVPVASGSLIMLLVAIVVNNFARKRRYPVFW
ncbi:hypothetical protein DICPUDRAFT_90352 [Dictyostelium purpureum]|uniref:HPP transmembrane region domain-containing protein n=1 Tax=Dictyostelium purpureum TaxID=5786 RepID=F1A1Z3_DICPU|nr:uncharacterized protein DICPUDRAFT_90352 [Dictyostelium purpureum]EGC29779.1 hypothetical protein DICPUDRAFT_90352 [Dictyostelium purpureum]|eukprot:XP_003293687.1 hypothetical protein DICPUDRAFT_90352 [Dictyostelium purpureum]